MSAKDRAFIVRISKELGLKQSMMDDSASTLAELNEPSAFKPSRHRNIVVTWTTDDEEDSDDESKEARLRVIKKYEKVKVNEAATAANIENEKKIKFEQEFSQWKADYYKVIFYFFFYSLF